MNLLVRSLVLLGAIVASAVYGAEGCSHGFDLDAAIRRELPPGTSRRQVVAYLERCGIRHHDSNEIRYFKGPRTVWGLFSKGAGIPMVRDTVLTFEFDPEDRLVSYSQREQLVGP